MRVSRASLRVSLFGGGTDLPSYYELEGATIVSFALDCSIYVTINPRPTGGSRLSYSKVEELRYLSGAEHDLVAEAATAWVFKEPCTMSIVSDIPKGTGLGSSSALTVALHNISELGRISSVTPFELERRCSPSVGQQDFLPAIYGGLREYTISPSGEITTHMHSSLKAELINQYGVLLYTGLSRQAADILPHWDGAKSDLHDIQDIAEEYARADWDLGLLGSALHETWVVKSSIEGVCTYDLYEQYEKARRAGVLGGNLCGAGSGGCWFFITEDRDRLVEAMGLTEIPFRVAEVGSEVVTI